jgi:hypothetical protein
MAEIKLGVTGTREGMNETQRAHLSQFLTEHRHTISELHHGDCAGVDAEVATLVTEMGIRTVCHPPRSDHLRAFHASNEYREPKGYLARDRQIVEDSDLLLVVPLQDTPQQRGGTWYTYSYAKQVGRPFIVFYPDGRIVPSANNG